MYVFEFAFDLFSPKKTFKIVLNFFCIYINTHYFKMRVVNTTDMFLHSIQSCSNTTVVRYYIMIMTILGIISNYFTFNKIYVFPIISLVSDYYVIMGLWT